MTSNCLLMELNQLMGLEWVRLGLRLGDLVQRFGDGRNYREPDDLA